MRIFLKKAAKLTQVPAKVANWVVNDLLRELSQRDSNETVLRGSECLPNCKVTPESLAELVNLIEKVSSPIMSARNSFPKCSQLEKGLKNWFRKKGLEMKSDGDEIESLCSKAIKDDPDAADKFRGGKEGAINALKGAVMKATRGQANPKLVDETLRTLLNS